jgi:hypothetical protein
VTTTCFLEKWQFPVAANRRGNRCGNRRGNQPNPTAAGLFIGWLPRLPQFTIIFVDVYKRGKMDVNERVQMRIPVYSVQDDLRQPEQVKTRKGRQRRGLTRLPRRLPQFATATGGVEYVRIFN